MTISYDCSELIDEINSDIAEFGAHAPAWALYETKLIKIPFSDAHFPCDLCVSYLLGRSRPRRKELENGHLRAELLTLEKIRDILVAQDLGIEYDAEFLR